jgi:hypothetical protein
MTTRQMLTVYFDGSEDRTLEITYTPRALGGWTVRRAYSGRLLGWLTYDKTKPVKKRWEARA